jgi:hypothetical protein
LFTNTRVVDVFVNRIVSIGVCARYVRERDWEIDVVVPVPDGSRPSAIEIAQELEMPYREAGLGTFHQIAHPGLGAFHVILQVKTPIDDSRYGPRNQSDTREWSDDRTARAW